MPNYRRLFVPGGTYFFTVNLYDRRQSLLVDHINELRAAWRETQLSRPFETIAAVVLPDHLHFVWHLADEDDDFPTRIRLIKKGFTRRLPEDLKRTGRKGERNIWQRRFWEHLIRDDEDLNRHVDYIHFNPVKHGFVQDPDDWPYSTWFEWKEAYGETLSPSPGDWGSGSLGEA